LENRSKDATPGGFDAHAPPAGNCKRIPEDLLLSLMRS